MASTSRTVLQKYFTAGNIPSQQNFWDLLDSMLNQADDGIAKTGGNPLQIAAGNDQSLINFYPPGGLSQGDPSWQITQGPGPGLSIQQGGASSPVGLFIQKDTGNVGIGTDTVGGMYLVDGATPSVPAKLTVSTAGDSTHYAGLQLRRESSETTGGTILYLELYQDDNPDISKITVPMVYPNIRFHHFNRFWYRIEARGPADPDDRGFHFLDGILKATDPPTYVDIYANNLILTGGLKSSHDISANTLTLTGSLNLPGGSTILTVGRDGKVSPPLGQVKQLWQGQPPQTLDKQTNKASSDVPFLVVDFQSSGGTLLILFSGTASASQVGLMSLKPIFRPANNPEQSTTCTVWSNLPSDHLSFPAVFLPVQAPQGTHQFEVWLGQNVMVDQNDVFSLTIIEFPI